MTNHLRNHRWSLIAEVFCPECYFQRHSTKMMILAYNLVGWFFSLSLIGDFFHFHWFSGGGEWGLSWWECCQDKWGSHFLSPGPLALSAGLCESVNPFFLCHWNLRALYAFQILAPVGDTGRPIDPAWGLRHPRSLKMLVGFSISPLKCASQNGCVPSTMVAVVVHFKDRAGTLPWPIVKDSPILEVHTWRTLMVPDQILRGWCHPWRYGLSWYVNFTCVPTFSSSPWVEVCQEGMS